MALNLEMNFDKVLAFLILASTAQIFRTDTSTKNSTTTPSVISQLVDNFIANLQTDNVARGRSVEETKNIFALMRTALLKIQQNKTAASTTTTTLSTENEQANNNVIRTTAARIISTTIPTESPRKTTIKTTSKTTTTTLSTGNEQANNNVEYLNWLRIISTTHSMDNSRSNNNVIRTTAARITSTTIPTESQGKTTIKTTLKITTTTFFYYYYDYYNDNENFIQIRSVCYINN